MTWTADSPIMFLDFDGVLVVGGHVRTYPNDDPDDFYMAAHRFHPGCVQQINRVLEETGASVVVSSNWRKDYSLDDIVRMLEDRGFEGGEDVIGQTPILDPDNYVRRGREIDAWMTEHGEPDRYVILDDDHRVGEYKSHLVPTQINEGGLTEGLADRAIEILNGHL